MRSVSGLTVDYVKEHPHIRNCLKKGLINYSALARAISEDLGLENKASKEAILVAARRFREVIIKESSFEKELMHILRRSEMTVRNRISVYTLDKQFRFDKLSSLQARIKSNGGTFFLLEGSAGYTIIVQSRYSSLLNKFRVNILNRKDNLVLINLKSHKDIERTPGIISYLTSLFAENGTNIIEFFSCWTDTVFIIRREDLNKAMDFLSFE